jgi:hypothetical protein
MTDAVRSSKIVNQELLNDDFTTLWSTLRSVLQEYRDKPATPSNDFSSSALDWTGLIFPDDDGYIGGGSFGDVYEGRWGVNPPSWHQTTELPRVVVKIIRIPAGQDKKGKVRDRVG